MVQDSPLVDVPVEPVVVEPDVVVVVVVGPLGQVGRGGRPGQKPPPKPPQGLLSKSDMSASLMPMAPDYIVRVEQGVMAITPETVPAPPPL